MATPSKYFLFCSHSELACDSHSSPQDGRLPPLGRADVRHIGIAQPRGRLDQRIEHRLQIEGRAADDLEHVGGGGLLLQRLEIVGALAQLVEQARVLDGDDGLLAKFVTSSICLSVNGRPPGGR